VNRRAGNYVLVAVVATGIAFASVPFLRSFSANDRARSEAVTVATGDLSAGGFRVIDTSWERIYVIREPNEQILVLAVPLRDGVVSMPEFQWWRHLAPCRDFGPSTENGKITPGTRFTCRDADPDFSWAQRYWNWDSAGKALGSSDDRFDDIPRVPFEQFASYIIVKRHVFR
jgi:hypothetical protein